MHSTKLQVNFFYALLLIVIGISFFIFLPFLKVLFLATVFAVIFYPLYQKLLPLFRFKGGASLSAFLTVVIVLLVILIPFVGLSILIFKEISTVYFALLSDTANSSLVSFFTHAGTYINNILPFNVVPEMNLAAIQGYAGQGYQWIFNHFQTFFSSILNVAIATFIMILALFFFLRDGEKFKNVLIQLSPLSDSDDEHILHKMRIAVGSVIKGSLFIALVQGFFATIGFAIFGVPSAILWGAVAVLAAIIPTIGTALVMLPAVVFLFFTKGLAPALGLLIWSVVIVGLVDNLVGPLVVRRGIKIHPFLILLSILGGLSFFGPIGFLAGPVIMSLLFALVDMYPRVTDTKTPGRKNPFGETIE